MGARNEVWHTLSADAGAWATAEAAAEAGVGTGLGLGSALAWPSHGNGWRIIIFRLRGRRRYSKAKRLVCSGP